MLSTTQLARVTPAFAGQPRRGLPLRGSSARATRVRVVVSRRSTSNVTVRATYTPERSGASETVGDRKACESSAQPKLWGKFRAAYKVRRRLLTMA